MGFSNDFFKKSKASKRREERNNPLRLPNAESNYTQPLQGLQKETTAIQNGKKEAPKSETAIHSYSSGCIGNGSNELFEGASVRTVHGFSPTVNQEKQLKHIQESQYYIPGRSVFLGTTQDAERLVKQYGGKGEWMEPNRERIEFGQKIGIYIDPETGEGVSTSRGIIHYSKNGAHIVPANPNGGK